MGWSDIELDDALVAKAMRITRARSRRRGHRSPASRGSVYRALVSVALFALAMGCGRATRAPESPETTSGEAALKVSAVNYPLVYFAERIGGDAIEASFSAPAGIDPAEWSPDADAVVLYQQADLILLNGAGYASWVDRVSLQRARLVDTAAAIGERYIPLDDEVTHTHGPSAEHSHVGFASTLWLDPTLALEQARAVRDAFVMKRPTREQTFADGLAALEKDLGALDSRLEHWASVVGEEPVLFSHPVYQYFVRRYSLNARALHWEPGEVPTAKMWRELRGLLETHPARVMIWEGEPLEETRRELSERGVESLVFALASSRPASGDFLSVMQGNAETLEGVWPDPEHSGS